MPSPTAASTTSGPVERAFLVLQTVAAAGEPVGVRELGRLTGLPRSTAARLAAQLVDLGMLGRGVDGDLVSGPGLASLQPAGGTPSASLEDLLRPLLHELVDRFGESAALTVDTPAGAFYLAQVPGPSAVQVPDSTGSSLPFHVVAPGLVLMAEWDDDRLSAYVVTALDRPTEFTVTDPSALRRRLSDIAADRSAWTDQELDLEINGLAVPVHDHRGDVIAAVSLYGPAYRFNPIVRPELAGEFSELVDQRVAMLLR